MSFADERTAIENLFSTGWALTAHASVPIVYDNFDETFSGEADPWIRLTIKPGDSAQISLGSSPYCRYAGVVTVQVFVRVNTGTVLIRTLAEAVANILRREETLSGESGVISFTIPRLVNVGVENGWFQMNVITNYKRDKIET